MSTSPLQSPAVIDGGSHNPPLSLLEKLRCKIACAADSLNRAADVIGNEEPDLVDFDYLARQLVLTLDFADDAYALANQLERELSVNLEPTDAQLDKDIDEAVTVIIGNPNDKGGA